MEKIVKDRGKRGEEEGEKKKNNKESFEMKFWNTMKAFTIFDFNENYEK